MTSKRRNLALWICYLILVLLSVGSVCFGLALIRIIPMVLNDSSPNFGQLADADRWRVYHEAQSTMTQVTLTMLTLVVLWSVLAGFTICRLTKSPKHETHEKA